jgi:receptor protein-tyrosine kinase
MDAARYVSLIRRWWWLPALGALAAVAAYGVTAGFGSSASSPGAYRATSSLLVKDTRAAKTLNIGPFHISGAGAPSADAATLAASYARIADGPIIAGRLAAVMGQPDADGDVLRRVTATVAPGTQVVEIEARADSAEEAQVLSRAAADAFMALHDERSLPGTIQMSESSRAQLAPLAGDSGLPEVLLVALGGFLTAVALIIVFERIVDPVHDAADVERVTGLPVVAHIPVWHAAAGDTRRIAASFPAGARAAEHYRMLRTNLALEAGEEPPVTTLFASSLPGDGATTTAINYAVALAQTGRQVVLIDADLRNPALRDSFHIEHEGGLVDILEGDADLDEVLHLTTIETLSVLPAGAPTDIPAELIASERFQELLGTLRDDFDAVIIDGPPVLACTDATLLAAEADETIVVLRAERTARESAARAVAELRRATESFGGVVLNADPMLPDARTSRGRSVRQPAPAVAQEMEEGAA